MAEEKMQMTTNTQKDGTKSSVSETIASLKGIPTREDLINLLKKEIVEVTFTKLNGDTRVMPCTLIEEMLPPASKEDPLTQKKIREVSDAVIPVWAIESKGFRSFRYDRVTSVKIIEHGFTGYKAWPKDE
jgi:hypothetical protein